MKSRRALDPFSAFSRVWRLLSSPSRFFANIWGRTGSTILRGSSDNWGWSFEWVEGGCWIGRGGPHHKDWRTKDPFVAQLVIVPTIEGEGEPKGFAGAPGYRLIKHGIKEAERQLNIALPVSNWVRIKRKAKSMFEAKIVMEYREAGKNSPKARATLEYFEMEQ